MTSPELTPQELTPQDLAPEDVAQPKLAPADLASPNLAQPDGARDDAQDDLTRRVVAQKGVAQTGVSEQARSSTALVNAAKAALLTFVLAIPFVGVRLDIEDGHNTLDYRPLWVAALVALAFVGRLAFEFVDARRAVRPALPRARPHAHGLPRGLPRGVGTALAVAAAAAALAFPFTPLASRYALDLAASYLTYVMLGWGLNIVVGLAGLLDLGYVAFYAAGAYTFGILATSDAGVSFWIALPLAGLLAGTLGIALGFPVLRLKGDYLAIVTLGFGEIIRIVLINWSDLTGGPNGITGIPRPSFFGAGFTASAADGGTTFSQLFGVHYSPLQRVAWLYYVVLGLALATLIVTRRLRQLPIGRAWEALREDETACRALGLNPTIIKLTAFAIGASIGGFAGCFFAARQGFISPESFTFTESATILAIVVLGGMGSQRGVAAAAAVLVGLPELGRAFAQYRMLVFGIAMVLIMVWRPQGMFSGRTPSVRAGPAGRGR